MNNCDDGGEHEASSEDINLGEASKRRKDRASISREASKKRWNGASTSNSGEASEKGHNGSSIVAKINKLTCYGTKKITVKCNRLGKGVCKFSRLMQTHISYLVRRCVSIEYTTWKQVPKEIKRNVANAVKNVFDVPYVMAAKEILKSVDTKWKNFKSGLRKFVIHEGLLRVDPPFEYIKQEAWETYVQRRCTKEFQEMSRKNLERAKKNMYPYRLSKKGYARKEREMLKEQGKDPDTCIIPRAKMWKVARQAREGIYYDKETAEVAKKIDMYTEQQSQGTLTLSSSEDILSLALEKGEQYGHQRDGFPCLLWVLFLMKMDRFLLRKMRHLI